jgi:acetyl-CoA carboxylase biotin carboxyl carrier protein
VSINYSELRELLQAIAQTDITELILKSEDFELTVRKSVSPVTITPRGEVSSVPISPPVAVVSPPTLPTTPPVEVISPTSDKRWVAVTAPMVGTFYRSPAPGEPPFIEVNERIRTGQAVCIIEAMKLFNEIESEVSGRIVKVLVDNSSPVEYDQPLFLVDPS